jgi:hypothetical protein
MMHFVSRISALHFKLETALAMTGPVTLVNMLYAQEQK